MPVLCTCRGSQNRKTSFQSRVPNFSICKSTLPSLAFNSSTPPATATLMHFKELDELCGGDGFYIDFNTTGTIFS